MTLLNWLLIAQFHGKETSLNWNFQQYSKNQHRYRISLFFKAFKKLKPLVLWWKCVMKKIYVEKKILSLSGNFFLSGNKFIKIEYKLSPSVFVYLIKYRFFQDSYFLVKLNDKVVLFFIFDLINHSSLIEKGNFE